VSHTSYLFIWDNQQHRVVASFCIVRAGTDAVDVPTDTSHGPIPADEQDERVEALRREYPLGRYTFGGGYASSLAECVRAFFGLEKDYRHFFEEAMAREEAAAIAERYLNDRYPDPNDHLVVLADGAIEKPYGWVFFYQSRRYLDTRNFLHRLVGNGPVAVLRDGTVHTLGSALGPEEEIRDFEVRLGFLGDA
jgi:hypothetical protein